MSSANCTVFYATLTFFACFPHKKQGLVFSHSYSYLSGISHTNALFIVHKKLCSGHIGSLCFRILRVSTTLACYLLRIRVSATIHRGEQTMYVDCFDGYGAWQGTIKVRDFSQALVVSRYLYSFYWPQWNVSFVK